MRSLAKSCFLFVLLLLACFAQASSCDSAAFHGTIPVCGDTNRGQGGGCSTFTVVAKMNDAGMVLSQNGSIAGYVFSGTYKNRVPGVVISLVGASKFAVSDSMGRFEINDLKPGIYNVKFSGLGFKTFIQSIKVKAGKQTYYAAGMQEDALQLSEVVIRPNTLNTQSGYSSLSQLDIQLRPVSSAQDLLRLVPGLFIAQHAGGGKAEQIFLRGFDCDHGTDFATFVDGIPVNMISHAHGQGYADMHFVIPETVKELDVYKGPYYACFGDLATSGAGEIKTYNVLPRNQATFEYGQFNTWRGLLMLNLLDGKSHLFSKLSENLYVASEYRYTDSYFDHPQHFWRFNGLLKYYGQLTQKTTMTISASNFQSAWNASGQIPERAVAEGLIDKFGSIDPSEGGQTSRTNINLSFDRYEDNGDHLKNQFYYCRYDFNLFSDFTFYLEDSVHGDEINQRDHRNMLGYNGTYSMKREIAGVETYTDLGVGARYDNSHVSLLHADKRVVLDTFVDGRLNQLNTSAWADEHIKITPLFTINPGLRLDVFDFSFMNIPHPDSSGDVVKARVSPKLNFFYDLDPSAQLYLKTGIGFHSNDARAVIINKVEYINDNILPKAYGADLGALLKPCPDLIINFSLWTLYLENELVYSGDDGTVTAEGPTMRKGADLGIRQQFLKHFYLDADLNYNYGRRVGAPADSVYIPLAPVVTSTAGISYKSETGFNGGVRYRYLGDRPANEAWSRNAAGYYIMDAMLAYTTRRWEIGLSAENIFNVYWKEAQFDTTSRLQGEATPVTDIAYTPGTPRSIKGHITVWF